MNLEKFLDLKFKNQLQ